MADLRGPNYDKSPFPGCALLILAAALYIPWFGLVGHVLTIFAATATSLWTQMTGDEVVVIRKTTLVFTHDAGGVKAYSAAHACLYGLFSAPFSGVFAVGLVVGGSLPFWIGLRMMIRSEPKLAKDNGMLPVTIPQVLFYVVCGWLAATLLFSMIPLFQYFAQTLCTGPSEVVAVVDNRPWGVFHVSPAGLTPDPSRSEVLASLWTLSIPAGGLASIFILASVVITFRRFFKALCDNLGFRFKPAPKAADEQAA